MSRNFESNSWRILSISFTYSIPGKWKKETTKNAFDSANQIDFMIQTKHFVLGWKQKKVVEL